MFKAWILSAAAISIFLSGITSPLLTTQETTQEFTPPVAPPQVNSTPQEPTPAGPFMRAKLAASQDVLSGLVSEDFALIRRGAASMKAMSETVQWPRADDPIYSHYGKEFRRLCDRLVTLADEEDLEVAHLTYLQLTTSCIRCHDYVRGKFQVQRDTDDPKGPVRLIPTEWPGKTFEEDRTGRRIQDGHR